MIKILLPILVVIFSIDLLAAHHSSSTEPVPGEYDFDMTELTLRYLKKINDWRVVGELVGRDSFEGILQSHAKLGFNYRLHSNFKLGLHYKYQKAVRHNDSWRKGTGIWFWDEDIAPGESILIPELIGRMMLMDALRGELRLQYHVNTTLDHETLKIRPSLTYFWLREGKAFMNFYLMYEQYQAINFANEGKYQSWLYLGFLHHLTNSHKWGLYISRGGWTWTESQDFIAARPGETYSVEEKATIMGLNYTFTH